MNKSKKPIIYSGGGVINSGPEASNVLRELVELTGFPITSTLQGLGAYPGDDNQFLGMLGTVSYTHLTLPTIGYV